MDTPPLTPFSLRDHRLIPRLGYDTVREHIIADLNANYHSENSRHYFPSAKARTTAALILAELPPPVYLSLPLAQFDSRELPDGCAPIYPRHNGQRGRSYGGFVCRDRHAADELYTHYLGTHRLTPGEERALTDELNRTTLPLQDFCDVAIRDCIDRGRSLHFTGPDRAQILARIDAAHNATHPSGSNASIDEAIRTGLRILSQRGQIEDSLRFEPTTLESATTVFGILLAKTPSTLAILSDDTTGAGVLVDRIGIRFPLRADGRGELTPNTLAPIAIRMDSARTGFAVQTRSHNNAPTRFDDRESTLLLASAMVDPALHLVVSTDINDAQHDVDGRICGLTPYYAAVLDAGATIEPISRSSISSGTIGDIYQHGPSFATPTQRHQARPLVHANVRR